MYVSWPMWWSVRLYWRPRTSSPLISFCLGNSRLGPSSQHFCCSRRRGRSSSGIILYRYLRRREGMSRGLRSSPGDIGLRSIDCCENIVLSLHHSRIYLSNTRQCFDQTGTASPPAHFCDSIVAQVVCKSLQHCRDFSTPVFHLYEEYLLNSGSLATKLMVR